MTPVRSVEKGITFLSQSIIRKQKKIKKIANLKYKKGHHSGKDCRKIIIIELNLDIHKIHLHTAPSFNLIFRSQVVIRKLRKDSKFKVRKRTYNSGRSSRKIVIIVLDLNTRKIH